MDAPEVSGPSWGTVITGGATGTDVAGNLRQHAEAARGAYASNTERALRADVVVFTAWCDSAGRRPLPASPETVATFIDAMNGAKAPATIRRYSSSVATFHRAAGVPNPVDTQVVKLALKRLHRAHGRAQQQAAPLTDLLVARMLLAAGGTLHDLRDKALLATAYVTLCRRSELVGLMTADLQVEADGFGTIAIRRSKTDQEGAGDVAPITPDAMRHVQAWIAAGGISDGPLFRTVRKAGRLGETMDPGDVGRVFKAMAKRAGLTPEETARISGHSTRVGAAQDAIRYGAELPAVMQAGRWKTSEMVARYTRRLSARRSAAVQIADRRVGF